MFTFAIRVCNSYQRTLWKHRKTNSACLYLRCVFVRICKRICVCIQLFSWISLLATSKQFWLSIVLMINKFAQHAVFNPRPPLVCKGESLPLKCSMHTMDQYIHGNGNFRWWKNCTKSVIKDKTVLIKINYLSNIVFDHNIHWYMYNQRRNYL